MVTTLSTSCNCRSQTWLVFIFVIGILSITILIQFFPFLKCAYIFWHPLYNDAHCIHYIRVFRASSLTVLVLMTVLFPFWSFLLPGQLLYYFIILTPNFRPYAWWHNVLQWWLTPAVLILYIIWATSLIGLMAIRKLCVYLIFYFLNLAHECRCIP